MTTATVKKPVSAKQFEDAQKRYKANAAATKKIIDVSEAKIQKEMEARHKALGNMPKLMETDAAIIQQYCEENRQQLFADCQSIETAYGTLSFRKGNFGMKYPEDVKEKVVNKKLIAAFKKGKLTLYIKQTEALDKNKIIADREDKKLIKILEKEGVCVDQGTTFTIGI